MSPKPQNLTPFANVYPLYVPKAERKQRTKQDVDRIICWLTGCNQARLEAQLERQSDFETFFAPAPPMHPNNVLIKGVVCGVRVEEVERPADAEDPLPGQSDRRTRQGPAA